MTREQKIYEALAELWRWSQRNGKTPMENGATVDTFGEVETMVTEALAGNCFACHAGVRNVIHAPGCRKAGVSR